MVPSFAGMKLYMFSASLDCDCFFVPPGPGFLGGAFPRLFGVFPPRAPPPRPLLGLPRYTETIFTFLVDTTVYRL